MPLMHKDLATMKITTSALLALRGLLLLLLTIAEIDAFLPQAAQQRRTVPTASLSNESTLRTTSSSVAATAATTSYEVATKITSSSSGSSKAEKAASIKHELLELAKRTERGFRANAAEKKRARELLFELAKYNPTREPARAYYETTTVAAAAAAEESNDKGDEPSVRGKWTLVFTDAPDITSLDQNAFAELGRIGQECNPPFIKNVIEWKRPSWAASLPLAGNQDSRIIQKVVTKGKARPSRPTKVKLEVAGLQVETDGFTTGNLRDAVQKNGLIAGLVQANPVNLDFNAPFGEFELLYLDDELRVTLTGQNYVAVNTRVKSGEEWF